MRPGWDSAGVLSSDGLNHPGRVRGSWPAGHELRFFDGLATLTSYTHCLRPLV